MKARVLLVSVALAALGCATGGSGSDPQGVGGAVAATGEGGGDATSAGGRSSDGEGGSGAGGAGSVGGAAGSGSGVAGKGATGGTAGGGRAGAGGRAGGSGGRGGATAGTTGSAGGVASGGRGGATAGTGGATGGRGGATAAGTGGGSAGRGGVTGTAGAVATGGRGGSTNVPPLPTKSGSGQFAITGRTETAIEIVVPSGLGASPPLVIAFHATGDEPGSMISGFGLDTAAAKYKFVAVAPRAGYRDGVHPADVDHARNEGDSSWNMWSQGVDANEDLRYVLALIDSAHATFNVDTTRVYTIGFSNGAFFSYFAAISLSDRIAGFGENSGGWTTASCPVGGSGSYQQHSASVPNGTTIPCSQLFADSSFPVSCEYSATNALSPPPLPARIPFGYLAHYSSDPIVSVQWSCILGQGLGTRAQANIRYQDSDGTNGHNIQPDFIDRAWTFFNNRSTGD